MWSGGGAGGGQGVELMCGQEAVLMCGEFYSLRPNTHGMILPGNSRDFIFFRNLLHYMEGIVKLSMISLRACRA